MRWNVASEKNYSWEWYGKEKQQKKTMLSSQTQDLTSGAEQEK